MGKEAAKKLIQQGHKVYTAARRIDQMQDLKAMGGFPLQMDISNLAGSGIEPAHRAARRWPQRWPQQWPHWWPHHHRAHR